MSTLSPSEKARTYFEIHEHDKDSGGCQFVDGPCITISRETGAGANFVCDALLHYFDAAFGAHRSPWTVFDKNLIDKVIEDHHLPAKLKHYLSEAKFSAINTAMNEMLGIHPPMVTLLHKTTETILQLAEIGYCVIVGRGANLITAKMSKAFHVRLIAPYETRLENMKKHYDMDTRAAAEFIKKEDAKRRKFVETHFNHNPDDPHQFDLILNTGRISFEECARTIGEHIMSALPVTRKE